METRQASGMRSISAQMIKQPGCSLASWVGRPNFIGLMKIVKGCSKLGTTFRSPMNHCWPLPFEKALLHANIKKVSQKANWDLTVLGPLGWLLIPHLNPRLHLSFAINSLLPDQSTKAFIFLIRDLTVRRDLWDQRKNMLWGTKSKYSGTGAHSKSQGCLIT